MMLNTVGYSTSKSSEEIVLKGDYEITSKILNNRIKVIDNQGEVFWIAKDTMESDTQEVISDNSTKERYVCDQDPLYHTVSRGESIQSIAKKFNTDPTRLVMLNGSAKIAIGTKIRVR